MAFAALRVLQGMWRFSGFGDVQRIAVACGQAGLTSAVAVLMLLLNLFEELLAGTDTSIPTRVERLRVARLDGRPAQIQDLLAWSRDLPPGGDGAVQARLTKLVPEYRAASGY